MGGWGWGWEKENIFRKSSLNFTFGKNDHRKSGLARPNSREPVIVLNFGRLEIVILNNFAWHFSSCDYSISMKDPETLPHLK